MIGKDRILQENGLANAQRLSPLLRRYKIAQTSFGSKGLLEQGRVSTRFRFIAVPNLSRVSSNKDGIK